MARSRPLVLELLEDRLAPASLGVPGVYPGPDADLPPVQTFVTGSLGPGAAADGRLLEVVDGQQFHFILSAVGAGAPAGAGVRLTVADPAGGTVFALAAGAGTTWDGDVFLAAGAYRVSFTEAGSGSVGFELSGWGLWGWGWLGPQLNDTTQQPLEASAAAAVPAPASFFFLPENATDLFGAALAARGPSFQAAPNVGGAGASGGLGSALPALSPSQRAGPAGPQAGAGARRDVDDVVPGDPTVAAPAAVPRSAGGQVGTAAAVVELPPDGPAAPKDSEVVVASQSGPVVMSVAAAQSPSAAGPAQVNSARVFWALGLGTAVLTSLALPARWCAVLVPERLRLGVRKRREMVPTA
ncbi:MAG TPA: hypothetical protein VFW33_06125 [Gemmataceae bacterium]|nr:hypothetical protein [Gemmataceae bacterium]